MTTEMQLLLVVAAAGSAFFFAWRKFNPPCPTCAHRSWDRKLCNPLLLCRRCSQRIDRDGRKHN